ncbi:MAG: cyclic nucleotide-binding domain-containing protein [Proteobacteria bacterium]|jgi:CRP-like cAMP-binding protein|nr:cyclic nucleotide-binding domain-containing protein [Desulfocapsa sp.]MBU3943374.1 cyclic nucleotide-binding domain-containing protein [Pseudomonadota bacterium]MBU4029992.1 cyclic nucleotide-binding domain-containing protein [Pseudomonadota bacterium]MBU4041859.1 cyclic nucleotide-binding domain-containing protein [Pseudomonadota bacterium]MBU4085798.1 cyclic nucleotide-binding domain-containing protein [Pseudomonadota bacterium]
MDIDQEQKEQALQKAKELMAAGEKQRAHLRLSRQLEEFELGNIKVLLHDEFVGNISQRIIVASHDGPPGRAESLVEKLGKHACDEDGAIRERAVMALSFCSGLLSAEEHVELLDKVTFMLAHWLKVETTYYPVCETVCRQLQQNGLRMLDEGRWQQFDSLLEILFQIQSGVLEKGNVIRGLVARTLDTLAVEHILEELTLVCLNGQGGRQILAEKILTRLGRRSVIFLLEKLLQSQQKNERLRLIKLIPETGKVAVPVLKEYLTKDLPWYGIRNIVLLIAVMGDSSLVPLVLPSLKDVDIRVQQQVIDCIHDLGGVDKKKYLLSALSLVDDELKAPLVTWLGQLGCSLECADILLDLLAERDAIAAHVREDLLGQLCIALRLVPKQRTVILLRQLVAERGKQGKNGHDSVSLIARRTLQIIEPQLQPVAKSSVDKEIGVSFASDSEAEQRARLNLRDLDIQIQQFLQAKKIKEVTALIAEHAVHAAKEKDFVTAEILRDRMLAVNPNALIEVIRVSEAIEEEKSNAISSHHLSLWSELYDFLASDSFTALYHCQRFQEYKAEEVIVRQGDINSTLYFINAGTVSLTCRQGQKEIFIKRMKPGEIVGVGPFFDVSVWTVTLVAMSAVKVQILEREDFLKLLVQHPGLESSLGDFCRRSDKIHELLKKSGENRREEIRHSVQQIIVNNLLDGKDNTSQQKFRGQVEDLSLGGLSLMIRLSKKENARLLLGRRIVSSLPMGTDEVLERKGEIIGVSLQDYIDKNYRVHVRFDQPIGADDLKNLLLQWHK